MERSWFRAYLSLFRGHTYWAAFALALAVYLAGLAIALTLGFVETYVTSPPVYLGVLGIVWTAGFLLWSGEHVPKVVEVIEDVFVDTAAYQHERARWLFRLFDQKIDLMLALPVGVALWWRTNQLVDDHDLPWLSREWAQPENSWAANLIIDLYAAAAALLGVTTSLGIVFFVVLVLKISRLELVPVLDVTRARLRPITDFGVATGLGWAFGLSLLVLVLQPSFDLTALVVVAVLATLGILLVLGPQFVVHVGLARTQRQLAEGAVAEFFIHHPKKELTTTSRIGTAASSPEAERLRLVLDSSTWIYEPRDVASLAVNGLLPIATFGVSLLF